MQEVLVRIIQRDGIVHLEGLSGDGMPTLIIGAIRLGARILVLGMIV